MKPTKEMFITEDEEFYEESGTDASSKGIIDVRLVIKAVLIGLVLASLWVLYHYLSASSTEEYEKEAVIEKVSKLIVLPYDEEPILAAVVDVDELKKRQPFFTHAANGDQVLIYAKNAKAVLYSPVKDRIVNVGPLYLNNMNADMAASL